MGGFKMFKRFSLALLAITLLIAGLLGLTSSASAAGGYAGYVYTETNSASGNGILVFGRGTDGTLTALTTILTGGLGTGAGLGSQGALALTNDGRWLLGVNAGSNDISVISLKNNAITSQVNSGGTRPISVTVYKKLVYVLNAGSDNLSGFYLNQGILIPIPNSTRPLSGVGVAGAEVKFSPDGEALVVTEKGTQTIDTYAVNDDGTVSGPFTHPSSGAVPFGFDFGRHNTLVVSEAAVSGASSYRVSDEGGLKLVSGSVLNGQAAACWVAVTNNGRYAYTADAHNGMISSYAVANDGTLTLLNGTAGTPGGTPLDEAVTRNDQFLYVLNNGTGALGIDAFAIQSNGSLVQLPTTAGTQSSAAGLVAR